MEEIKTVNVKDLSNIEIKAMIYDKLVMQKVLGNEINTLEQELLNRANNPQLTSKMLSGGYQECGAKEE